MNSWALIFLGGDVGEDVLILGKFSTQDAAIAYAVNSASPWNYQPCDVWGPATFPKSGIWAPMEITLAFWVAIASSITPNGNVKPIAYGMFATKADARAWASSQGNPAAYSFGQIISAP
jgi:hypothetical protein